ncbi:copper chaperone PCu(A)C [Thiorhodococcus minor]|uniref:Copper chaperone PCu(A)C n=1 Tax=Thiorhodococcus minor TaxID=57489 RepID=A0A6M0K5J7_9GAMM|nr:copper chaperone PCu(A)C [Thiorhodococcus minor]NEV64571.1 copper chaperone PCu(A)C [Thiorhodococcus minor]
MSGLLRAKYVAVFSAIAVLAATACSPSDGKASGQVKIVDAWTMATPPGANVGAGYMRILNEGSASVRLVGGETPTSATVEIHRMSMDNGVMRMQPANEGLEIAAGASVELKPGGYHLMLIGLKAPFAEGASVPLTLVFEGDLRVKTTLAVRAMGGGGHEQQ